MNNVKTVLLALLMLASSLFSVAQEAPTIYTKTLVVTTADGIQTKFTLKEKPQLTIQSPYLVVKTNGIKTNFELEQMVSLKYIDVPVVPGDSYEDRHINTTDITTTVNYFMGKRVSEFNFSNADANEDEVLNVADIVKTANIIHAEGSSANSQGGSQSRSQNGIKRTPLNDSGQRQYALYNYRNDGDFNVWLNKDIKHIIYSRIDIHGVEHNDFVVQEVWTSDSVYRVPLETVDSIGFKQPAPVMREGLFYLRDYHASHTMGVDDLTLHFDLSIHQDSLPSVGQTILCVTQTTPYEEGFAGKVIDIQKNGDEITMNCEQAAVGDIFKQLVLVGEASSEVENNSRSRTRNWWTDTWVNIEDYDTFPINLDEQSFELFDGLIEIVSPYPKLTCSYYVYVNELDYVVYAKADLYHKDLTYKLNFTTDQLKSLKDYGEFFSALTSEEGIDEWLNKKFNESLDKYLKEEKDEQKIKAEKNILKKVWETKKVDIPIIGNGILNLSLMVAPLFKTEGSLEMHSELKTDAWQSLDFKVKGITLLPNSAHVSDFHASHRQDPIKDAKLDFTAKGTATLGLSLLLNANLIHRNVLYAGFGGELGMDVTGSLNVTLLDTEQPEMNWYDRLKDTQLKVSYYAKTRPEIGVTPLDFFHLSIDILEWKIFTKDYTYYIMPHFSEPTLPKFGNSTWLNKNPLSFYSNPSKDVFIPCKIGMRITDSEGNPVKEYLENNRYLDERDWMNMPLNINISDLDKGVSYKCYPTISFFGKEPFNAGPVHNFSVPLSMVASPSELTLKVGSTGIVEYFGGWDTFAVVITGDEDVVSFVNDEERTARKIKVLAEKVGTTTMQIEDRRTGEKIIVPITVIDEETASLQLSSHSLDLIAGKQGNVEITSGSGKYTVESSNTDVATVKINNGSIEVTAIKAGTTTITVTDTENNLTATIEVTVKEEEIPYIPDKTETFTVNGVSFNMVKVEGGTFMMGSETGDPDESPQHEVTLGNYYIGQTEVTQELWKAVMGSNSSKFTSSDQLPVDALSWDDCQQFVTTLNEKTGLQFRLPTEAEWEYASRGGNKTQGFIFSGSNAIDEVAWYSKNSGKQTHCVASKIPNELGLYDMSGNVWEWCQDWYNTYSPEMQTNPVGPSSGPDRVLRGGGYGSPESNCRSTNRDDDTASSWGYGMRLALSAGEEVINIEIQEGAVDLGLPSGTLWASCNLGATTPEETGKFYAWGETKAYGEEYPENKRNYDFSGSYIKTDFYPETYIFGDEDMNQHSQYTGGLTKYFDGDGKTTLDPEDDVAHLLLGGNWHIPTIEEWQELLDNCTIEKTEGGSIVKSNINNASIFLPLTGNRYENEYKNAGYGQYWSSTRFTSSGLDAQYMVKIFQTSSRYKPHIYNGYRFDGLAIRPVMSGKDNVIPDDNPSSIPGSNPGSGDDGDASDQVSGDDDGI